MVLVCQLGSQCLGLCLVRRNSLKYTWPERCLFGLYFSSAAVLVIHLESIWIVAMGPCGRTPDS